MKQFSDRAWSRFFLVSAIWNLYFSISALAMRDFNLKLAFGDEAPAAVAGNFYASTFYNFMFAAVLVFGIGYYIVSRDVNRNHGIVLLGIIGKLCFFVYYGIMYIQSQCTIVAFLSVTGDFIFALLFLYFLLQKRQSAGE
jgi:cytochrome c biogenesis factor